MLHTFAVACLSLLVAGHGVDGSLATGTPPSLYDYEYNGLTTYCYWIKQGMNITSFDYSYVKMEGKGSQCPVLISLAQTTTGTIYAGADVEYQFTVSLNFFDNSFGMKGLEATVLDPSTKRPVHIGHSNLHACSRTTVCDVFRDGANRRISAQETSNFTDEKALFTQRVNFARAGEYNVFAHVIVPPKNAAVETYQFVTFTTTTVSSLDGTSGGKSTAASASSEGMSTGATIGIIIGAVAALLALVMGVIFYRRKAPARMMTPGNDHFRNSSFMPSQTTKNSKQDWNGDPEFQFGHDRYQNSMVSEYNKQPPGLSASALMFQDNNRASRQTKQQKTVSSSGSSNRSGGSPRHRGLGGGGGTNGYGGSRKSTKSAIQLPDHGIGTYETYYNQEPSYEYHSNDLSSFKSEGSVGTTTHGYPNVAHAYAANTGKGYRNGDGSGSRRGYDHPQPHHHPHPPPIYESSGNAYPYDRESDLSSLHDDGDRYDHFDHHGLGPVSEMDRDSNASMGTVDFALPPPRVGSAFRPPGDSFRAEDVPNLADTKLAFNDEEVSKQTIEYIAALRNQNYRDTEQASDYASDFGSTLRTYDFRDSAQSDQVYGANSFHSSSTSTGVDAVPRAVAKKRTPSADSESYEF